MAMETMVWNALLTVLMAALGWAVKAKERDLQDTKDDLKSTKDELARVTILVNRTREEVAKEYVTKVDVHHDINRVLDRLDRLESKLVAFLTEKRSHD